VAPMAADVIQRDIIALVFDFDDTLVPDSTSILLKAHGVDLTRFWQTDVAALIEQGYDPPTAWLNLLLRNLGPDKLLGNLTNQKLREFGDSLDGSFYPGLPNFFDEIIDMARAYENIGIEFYIVSGGLYELAKGSKIVQKYFKAIYGCHLTGDTDDGVLKYIKRSITFTEKTRYIFEIHKGLNPRDTWRNPILVNKFVKPEDRRIPLRNMIYVGDGMTDIPCFSLLKNSGGLGFGVFDPEREKKAKEALEEFLQTDRVVSMHAPNYNKNAELGSILRAAVANRCSAIQLERVQPQRRSR
jgi:phosphoserine phosphatase